MERRTLLQLGLGMLAERLSALPSSQHAKPARRVVLITIGGIRRQESFSDRGLVNIPHLSRDLLPQSLFFPYTVNEGVTPELCSVAGERLKAEA